MLRAFAQRSVGPAIPYAPKHASSGSSPPVLSRERSESPPPTPTSPEPPAEPLELTKEDLTCPICQDLLVKPVVNACGHSFCFWCTHRAMDPLSPS